MRLMRGIGNELVISVAICVVGFMAQLKYVRHLAHQWKKRSMCLLLCIPFRRKKQQNMRWNSGSHSNHCFFRRIDACRGMDFIGYNDATNAEKGRLTPPFFNAFLRIYYSSV